MSHILGVNSASEKSRSIKHGIYKRYLVVKIEDNDFVFPVDEVGGVHRYDPDELNQIPLTFEPDKEGLILGSLDIDDRKVACIDAEKLIQVFEGLTGE